MSVEQTLKERGSRYGDFSVHAEICQDFMRVMKWARNQNAWPDLSDVQRQALTVIADKIARILSGDPDYADNWHDIQGYAKLVEERLPAAQHEQESRVAVAIDKLASHAELHSTIFAHDRFAPAAGSVISVRSTYFTSGKAGSTRCRAMSSLSCAELASSTTDAFVRALNPAKLW